MCWGEGSSVYRLRSPFSCPPDSYLFAPGFHNFVSSRPYQKIKKEKNIKKTLKSQIGAGGGWVLSKKDPTVYNTPLIIYSFVRGYN